MTPKEKAEELFNKYCIYLRAGLLYDDEAREDAKHCALIAVDEILKVTAPFLDRHENYYQELSSEMTQEYWIEVKQEIVKIIK
jgi:L-asparaginase/Glu-tRNA(Gln) amidotransferase subunit D